MENNIWLFSTTEQSSDIMIRCDRSRISKKNSKYAKKFPNFPKPVGIGGAEGANTVP